MESGAISSQEVLSACQQYAYLREALASQTNQLTQAALAGDDELSQALTTVLSTTITRLRELPSFQAQEPDAPLEEKDIRGISSLRAAAFTRARESAQTTLAPYRGRRRAFIHDLISKYSSTMPTMTEKQLDPIIDRSLLAAATAAKTAQTRERFAEMIEASTEELADIRLSPDQRARLKNDIVLSVSGNEEYFSAAMGANASERDLFGSLYEHLDLKRPDVFVDVVTNAPEGKTGEAIVRGVKLARVAESLEQRRAGGPASSRGFLSHSAAVGVTKGLQQAADGILSLVGEPLREMVYSEKINGTLRSLLSNTQELTDRLGGAFVHSAVFTQISQNLTKSLSEKPRGGQVGSVFGDVFSTIFRGPLDPALTGAAKDRLFDYMELARASANAPKGRAFLPADRTPWEIFISSQETAPGGRARSPLFGFPFVSLGALGGVVGDLFSSAVDKTTSFLFSNPSLPTQLNRSRRAALIPTPILEDMPLLVAIVVVAIIVILFIFPSPFNIPQIGYASKVGSLLASLFSSESASSSATPCIPGSGPGHENDCSWPLDASTHACISEGPFVGSHSQSRLDAMDFWASDYGDGLFGAPVQTPYSGTINSDTVFQYPDNSGSMSGPHSQDGHTYGNHVMIDTDRGGQLLFAHLRNINVANLSAGKHIDANAVIGFVDSTGYSDGSHLHYEARGASLDSFTPFHVPSCAGITTPWLPNVDDCQSMIRAEGHESCL